MPAPDPSSSEPALPETPPAESLRGRRAGVIAVTYWIVAGIIYGAFGVMVPWLFLLGFWQSIVFVAIVTALQPVVMRRLT